MRRGRAARALAALAAVALVLTLSGCGMVSANVDEQSYVLLLGVDKGEGHTLRLTARAPAAKAGSEDMISSAEGDSFTSALNALNASTSKALSYSQLALLIFSSELAREDIFDTLINEISRASELHNTGIVMVSSGRADAFVNAAKAEPDEMLSKSIEARLKTLWGQNAIPIRSEVMFTNFAYTLVSPYHGAMAIACGVTPEGSVSLEGTVLFCSDGSTLTLDKYETQLLALAQGRFNSTFVELKLDDARYDVHLTATSPARRAARIESGGVSLSVRASVTAIIRQELPDPSVLECAASARLRDDMVEMLEKALAAGADPVGFGGCVARRFATIDEFETFDAARALTAAGVSAEVAVRIEASE